MAPKQIGQYKLIKILGHGKTAEVHCARNRKSKEIVAIKLLHEYMTDQQVKQKFMEEAKLVKMLDHPGIVHIISADFYQQNRPYIVMSYASGNSLRKRHPSGVPLPLETIFSYTKQLADALDYAHLHNIVHCDVKPENVLLGKDDCLLLSDFGIAQIRETTLSQTTRDAFGTPTYMAPEQFRGKYSPATDQYALATMVYEWLCGHPPFSGANQNQLMDRHMKMPVPSLREACKGLTSEKEISEDVEQVILKALAKEPHERFSSIQEFAQALKQALPVEEKSLESTETIPQDIVQVPKDKVVRRSLLIGAMTIVLVILTGDTFSTASFQAEPTRIPMPIGFTAETNFLEKYRGYVSSLSWSNAAEEIAYGLTSNQFGILSVPDLKKIFEDDLKNSCTSVALSPDGQLLAVAGYTSEVRLYDWKRKQLLLKISTGEETIHSLSWSFDGKLLAIAGKKIVLWDVKDNKQHSEYSEHTGRVVSVVFSPKNLSFASAGADDETARTWEVGNPKSILLEPVDNNRNVIRSVYAVAYSSDGALIGVASEDGFSRIWDVKDPLHPNLCESRIRAVHSLSWIPGKHLLVSGGEPGFVHVCDEKGNDYGYYPQQKETVSAIALSPHSNFLAIASHSGLLSIYDSDKALT